MPPDRFFTDLQCAAKYVFRQGVPFFVSDHIAFMRAYLKAWGEQAGDEAVAKASADLDTFSAETRPNFHLVLVLVAGFFLSVGSSAWLALSKSIRIVPPLITAVVVVFVTSDSWRILGTGFTPRFFGLVALFLISSLIFLIRFKGYWEKDFDIDASDATLAIVLEEIQHELQYKQEAVQLSQSATSNVASAQRHDVNDASEWQQFHGLMALGANPLPLVKPVRRALRICHYCAYVAVSAFSLITIALAVSASMILVGLILINANQTKDLAQSVHIYLTLPGHLVITRQLVSLSLSLGAFATLFVVAGQRTEDREELMDNALALIRKAFVVYSVYGRAHDHAAEWTGVPVKSIPFTPEAQEPVTATTELEIPGSLSG